MTRRPLLLATLPLALAGVLTAQAQTPAMDAAAAPPAVESAPSAAVAPAADAPAPAAAAEAPVPAAAPVQGTATLKGKRFYISEYRVLIETGGSVTASTRAAYFGGTDRGGTRVTVHYQAPNLDVAALQAVADQAYADLLQRLDAAGARPEPADAITREFGTVYDAALDGTRPGTPVVEEVDLGYGKRRYWVFAPTGTRLNSRGFAGLGAGNIGNRIAYSKANVEAVSLGVAVHLAAQESSGSGSALFRRGSSAKASAAMEVSGVPRVPLLQGHARGDLLQLGQAVPVPGEFAQLREVGGYDTQQDAAVKGLQMLGALMLGVAGNQSKRVEMAMDVDMPVYSRMAVQGLSSVNQGIVAALR